MTTTPMPTDRQPLQLVATILAGLCGAATFNLTPPLPGQPGRDVHVAWAPLCPDTIFAATDSDGCGGGGIFRYVFGDPGWKDLGATPMYPDLGNCDCGLIDLVSNVFIST